MKEQMSQMLSSLKGSGIYRHFAEKILLPWQVKKALMRSSLAMFFFIVLCIAAFVSTRLLDSSVSSITGNSQQKSIFAGITFYKYPHHETGKKYSPQIPEIIPLNCSQHVNVTKTCPANYYPSKHFYQYSEEPISQQPKCPDYFRWIHEDLWPWRETGISLEMVEAAKAKKAAFRLVIVNSTAYIVTYSHSFQTRDVFSQWGILQLLRRYPGKVPDLDLIFACGDRPNNLKQFYPNQNSKAPPPVFGYDGDDATFDIVFPDWSFWGWPEINIEPWKALSKELKEGNERSKWVDREPFAFWKGNPHVSLSRMDLLKCNLSDNQDWNLRVYAQNWRREIQEGFKNSDLASQCKHRYKIYIEGIGWSVSTKYILACDSLTLIVKQHYYDFFTRSLMPLQHYWPIRDDVKCRSIKYAVDWGNSNQQEAQAMGKAASKFIQEELSMNYVYDYMFHLLTEYAKLLTYKPTVPPQAVELCSESMACPVEGLVKKYMMDSLSAGPSDVPPCAMPPPYDPATLHSVLQRKENSIKQVQSWEKQYWDTENKQN
ncbi:hypothetical protein ACH5RR_019681 [Cinchona calisaya]|uniref:Glycosyl transferase CAP10 domain-containing protein n=1 Tax=Cinchona calisaya TaxID=153742 RepID=A0ABD2ZQ28_9GENT